MREVWSFFAAFQGKQTFGLELFGHEMNFSSFAFENFVFLLTEEMKTILKEKK